jgi:hypothetical protein
MFEAGSEGAHLFPLDVLALSEDAFEFEDESSH